MKGVAVGKGIVLIEIKSLYAGCLSENDVVFFFCFFFFNNASKLKDACASVYEKDA